MANRGNPGRSWLLISTILLVWNVGASARQLWNSAPLPDTSAPHSPGGSSVGNVPLLSATDNVNARFGPLSLRQKYLLGKRIDINRATVEEIAELPGVSDAVAAAVVEERQRVGRFRSLRDLLGVRGIKEKRLKKILPFLSGLPNN